MFTRQELPLFTKSRTRNKFKIMDHVLNSIFKKFQEEKETPEKEGKMKGKGTKKTDTEKEHCERKKGVRIKI